MAKKLCLRNAFNSGEEVPSFYAHLCTSVVLRHVSIAEVHNCNFLSITKSIKSEKGLTEYFQKCWQTLSGCHDTT